VRAESATHSEPNSLVLRPRILCASSVPGLHHKLRPRLSVPCSVIPERPRGLDELLDAGHRVLAWRLAKGRTPRLRQAGRPQADEPSVEAGRSIPPT
jgi:hypothetical protein